MGIFDIFAKKNKSPEYAEKLTLTKFCEILNTQTDINVLKLLELPLSKFTKASQKEINSNPKDKKNGVIDVYVNASVNLFGIFNICVYKIFDNGNKQYFFYTTTKNANIVSEFANSLFFIMGDGISNPKYSSFKDFDKIENISKGLVYSEKDECVNMWIGECDKNAVLPIYLQYTVNPMQQFIFQIDENPKGTARMLH